MCVCVCGAGGGGERGGVAMPHLTFELSVSFNKLYNFMLSLCSIILTLLQYLYDTSYIRTRNSTKVVGSGDLPSLMFFFFFFFFLFCLFVFPMLKRVELEESFTCLTPTLVIWIVAAAYHTQNDCMGPRRGFVRSCMWGFKALYNLEACYLLPRF